MNLYFILEGEKTEVQLYPKWIEFIIPELTQVDFEKDIAENNYYIFSGGGIPSIYNHTINAIKNINDNPIFDKLIVCLDGEEVGVERRVEIAKNKIEESGVELVDSCEMIFIVQNTCIESWFLGNRRIVKRNPTNSVLKDFMAHHNVIIEDPEKMECMNGYRNKAHFNFAYLKEVFKEHNLHYSKSNPKEVLKKTYLEELLKRTNDTDHLPSLKNLFGVLDEIKKSLN